MADHNADTVQALQSRVAALERRLAELGEMYTESLEVIRRLAECIPKIGDLEQARQRDAVIRMKHRDESISGGLVELKRAKGISPVTPPSFNENSTYLRTKHKLQRSNELVVESSLIDIFDDGINGSAASSGGESRSGRGGDIKRIKQEAAAVDENVSQDLLEINRQGPTPVKTLVSSSNAVGSPDLLLTSNTPDKVGSPRLAEEIVDLRSISGGSNEAIPQKSITPLQSRATKSSLAHERSVQETHPKPTVAGDICDVCKLKWRQIFENANVPDIESALRRFCNHKQKISLPSTPQGFWDLWSLEATDAERNNGTNE